MLKLIKGNNFIVGSAVYLLSNILSAAIPLLLLPVLTRYLTPLQYGEIAIFQALVGALAAFIGLSIHGAAGRKFYDGNLTDRDLSEFIGTCLQVLFFTSVLTFAIIYLLSSRLKELLALDTHWILLAVLVTTSTVIIQVRLGQWQVRKQAKRYGALQVSHSLLNLGLSLLLVVFFGQASGGRITAQIIVVACFALLALWLLNKDQLLVFFTWRPDYISEVFKFGIPLIPHVAGIFLLASIDRFVINSKLGLAETGIYMVAVQFAGGFALIFDAINKAYVPWLFERLKNNQEHEKRKIVRFTYIWYLIILCGAFLGFLIGPSILIKLIGDGYSRAGDVVGWLLLGQVFFGMYLMVTNYIFYSKRTGMLSLVTILSGLINLTLLFVLIEKFGLEGAGYAFCIAMFVRFLLTWLMAVKCHSMPWFNFINKS